MPLGSESVVYTARIHGLQEPALAALGGGRVVMVWGDPSGSGGDRSGFAIRGRFLNADGTAASNPFLVNTQTTDDQIIPVVAALSGGRFVVAWNDLGFGGSILGSVVRAQLFGPDGGRIGAEFVVPAVPTGNQMSPAIAVLGDGRFVVGWADGERGEGAPPGLGIRGQLFDAGPAGPTVIEGTGRADAIRGTDAADLILGKAGKDRIRGGEGDDTLHGGGGKDVLRGEGGDDLLFGGAGRDMLFGGDGNDRLSGGGGGDRLDGGGGNDTMTGGAGPDVFVMERGGGVDRITDFSRDDGDRVALSSALWTGDLTPAEVVAAFGGTWRGKAALLFPGGEVLLFDGLAALAGIEAAIEPF
jgi:Ca2+-binding RTX toxin-like protein